MPNPFIPEYQQLPTTLPIFPLISAVVMPGAQLPLNIFEPRYLNMVQDVLASHHMIGMVQPDEDNPSNKHQLHTTGCAARISSYSETADGRIEIILTGVCRFDINSELPTTRGYRLITPNWDRFNSDYDFNNRTTMEDRQLFYSTLTRYLYTNQLQTDINQLEKLTVPHLVNILTTSLPLPHEDKQSIIDAVSFDDRYQLLIIKMEMASTTGPSHLKH
ncbi:MAG: LON peptidase substrate-binding domain-containing protein [Candidatus Thiodiazotropha sp. (ex. Lucinoma kazani)]